MYLYYNSGGYAGLVIKDNGYTQDVIQYSGDGNQIFYRFAPNVYITYHSNTDTIYASKTITQASDENLKLISPYKDEYDELLDKLEPIVYKWKDRPDGPDRVGLGARKTREALLDLGLDDSGFVCVYTDENGNEQYSVDYQERIPEAEKGNRRFEGKYAGDHGKVGGVRCRFTNCRARAQRRILISTRSIQGAQRGGFPLQI